MRKNFKKKNTNKYINKKNCDLFGLHAVGEAILNPKRHIHDIITTDAGFKAIKNILKKAKRSGLIRPEPKIVTKDKLESMLPAEAVHQGVAINAQKLYIPELSKFCNSLESDNIADNIFIILDQVTDPHNIGAILRSAAVFNAKAMIVQKKHTPEIKSTLAKVACGAVEHVPVFREVNIARTITMLQEYDILCVGLDERGKIELADIVKDKNFNSYKGVALVLGAEGEGIRQLTAKNCDILAKLPAKGKIKSLNVSNAAAIAIYEIAHS